VPEAHWSGAVGEYRLAQEYTATRLVLVRLLVLREESVPPERYDEVRQLKETAYAGDTGAFLLRP